MTTERTPQEDLLVGGLCECAYEAWVVESARLSGEADPAALRDLTLELIADVLRSGLMVAGDVVGDEHVPWHGSADDAARRIACEWLDEWGDEVPTPAAIVWLANTAAGDEIARAVLAREEGAT